MLTTNLYEVAFTLFGGYSQIPDKALGMALAGQINNGELRRASAETITAELDKLTTSIFERWEDQPGTDWDAIRARIVAGMAEQSEKWEETNPVKVYLRSLEG
jgi:hypothetical protein